jgi:putative hydrolase of the HAD superfamily
MISPTIPFDALVFDLGGVIVAHDNDLLYRRLAARCPVDDARDRIIAAARDERYGTGALPIAALHETLQHELGYDGDWPTFVADWSCHFTLDMAMLDLVERLASAQRIMLFSNTNREHWDFLVAASGGRLAKLEAYLSYEMGQVKPAPEAFRMLAARAGITAARSLFIDDLAANVEAARSFGFRGEIFVGQAALEARLAEGLMP